MPQLKEMKALFAKHDVEGLICEGAPLDEYDQEATGVAQKLNDLEFVKTKIDHSVVLKVLTDVWSKSFNLQDSDMEQRREEINKLAGKIEDILKTP